MGLKCQNYFLNDGGSCWRDFFRLHRRKCFSDVTGTNTVFDVEAGNRKLGPFWRRLWRERTAQKGAPRLTAENHVVWRNFPLNRKISNGWLRAWWSSIKYPLSIAESPIQKEIFLIADLRKFYQVSNSVAESPIRKEIFIIAERRQFFQVFYRGITMPRTQNLWMLNTKLEGVLPFQTLHKGIFKETSCWNPSQYIFSYLQLLLLFNWRFYCREDFHF